MDHETDSDDNFRSDSSDSDESFTVPSSDESDNEENRAPAAPNIINRNR